MLDSSPVRYNPHKTMLSCIHKEHFLRAHPAWIEVDIDQFIKNIASVRKKIGSRLLCLPVKANAYGHGLCRMAQIAQESGVDVLGVSCLQEALFLQAAHISIPILVFGAIHEKQIPDLINRDLQFTISSQYKAQLVAHTCKGLGKRCKVHVEVDTGMRRTGVRPDSVLPLLSFMDTCSCFDIIGVYSHLATADQPHDANTQTQIEIFASLAQRLSHRNILFHLANSGGVAYYPSSYFDMVRPGVLCYGYFPNGQSDPQEEIAPCLSVKARISYFKVVEKDQGISYGHLYRTNSQTRVVTIPVGYGDGFRRNLSGKASVLIRGKRFPVSGAICMDQFMVDIGQNEAYVGDEVVLIGKQDDQEILLWDTARQADSIIHEMLCTFSHRLPRMYTRSTPGN